LGKIKCQNASCVNFDRDYAERERATLAKLRSESEQSRPREGNFDPGENKIDLRYTNYLGVEGTYTGDRRTVRLSNEHLSLQLCPTGKRVSFARGRVLNLDEVQQWLKPEPTPRERNVLNYHKKRGTSSALYEQIRKKYPDP
jgi:hypothetical protein